MKCGRKAISANKIRKIEELNKKGMIQRDIGKILNITGGTVGRYLRRQKIYIKNNPGQKSMLTQQNKIIIDFLVRQSWTSKKIANYLGIPWYVVSYYQRKNKIKRVDKFHFNNEQRQIIKRMRLEGDTYRGIAKTIKENQNTVADYCQKKKIFPIQEDIPEGYKKCSQCGKIKLFSEYGKCKGFKNEIRPYCKKCHKKKRSTPEVKAARAKKQRCRRREDLRFQLDEAMSSAIRKALAGQKNGYKWETLVHYSLDDLMKHLEKQFLKNMNWNNHGKEKGQWSIDHIIPKSRFNYEKATDIDFQRCWALENLKPMWHSKNIAKSNKIKKPFQPCLKIEINSTS